MRLIDADALLYEMIGIHDGWFKPPRKVLDYEDLVKSQPTIVSCDDCPYRENNDRIGRPSITELG